MNKVFFVEGQNGVGKNYFIDRLSEELGKDGVDHYIVNCNDFIKDKLIQNNRYSPKEFTHDEMIDLFNSHVEILKEVKDLLECFKVVLVNRSFISYYIYNVKLSRFHSGSKETIRDELIKKVEEYLPRKSINLAVLGSELKYEDIKNRILSRDGDKRLDELYVRQLNHCYRNLEPEIKQTFNRVVYTDSFKYQKYYKQEVKPGMSFSKLFRVF